MGRLRVGEAMSPPFMRQVKSRLRDIIAANGRDAIIDAPPGVSCPAVNAVIDSDVIVLVTEPILPSVSMILSLPARPFPRCANQWAR